MNKPNRLKNGDKVEVIDSNSQHFGKIGELRGIKSQRKEMINRSSKVISSTEEYYFEVKLEDTETTETFTLSQIKKYNDC